MPRGRTPKPTATKKLEGNPGKRPLNKREPKPAAASEPSRPEGLTGDARKAWDRLAPAMHRAGLLSDIDADGLESYCRLYAHAKDCWRKAKKDGAIVSLAGKVGVNPYVAEARQAETLLHKLRSELGLNASSRSRIQIPDEADDDPDRFLTFPGAGA